MRQLTFWISVCLLCCSGAVLADTTLKMVAPGDNGVVMYYIKGDMVRWSIDWNDGSDSTYKLYDSAANTMTIVNPAQKSYMVLDDATIQAMSRELAKIWQRMQARMAKMPPKQRRIMKQMMDMGQPQPAPEVSRTGETKIVNGFFCQVYTISGPGHDSYYCMASIEELGIPESDYQSLRDLIAFSVSVAEQFSKEFGVAEHISQFKAAMEINGIPIKWRASDSNGDIKEGMLLSSVSTKIMETSLFTLPKGYTRQQIQ